MDPLSLPSITGGAAAPSGATANGPSSYVSMNNAFSVAGQGASANATASTTPLDKTTILLLAIVGAIALIGLK